PGIPVTREPLLFLLVPSYDYNHNQYRSPPSDHHTLRYITTNNQLHISPPNYQLAASHGWGQDAGADFVGEAFSEGISLAPTSYCGPGALGSLKRGIIQLIICCAASLSHRR